MFYKPELRKALREKRRHLDPASINTAAKQAASQIVMRSEFIESQTIGTYVADENELDPTPIYSAAHHLNKQLYLPVIPEDDDKHLRYYPYMSDDALIHNRYNILEPNPEGQTPIEINTLDILLVPLVGFDTQCQRIGRGAGFYDHTLAFIRNMPLTKRPLLIGLAYEFQKLPDITPSEWDVPLDWVVTEKNCYQR